MPCGLASRGLPSLFPPLSVLHTSAWPYRMTEAKRPLRCSGGQKLLRPGDKQGCVDVLRFATGYVTIFQIRSECQASRAAGRAGSSQCRFETVFLIRRALGPPPQVAYLEGVMRCGLSFISAGRRATNSCAESRAI